VLQHKERTHDNESYDLCRALTLLPCVLQCVAVCCNMLQCMALCGSVWQCVAVCGSVLQCVAAQRENARERELRFLQGVDIVAVRVAACCSVLQCAALCCSVLQCDEAKRENTREQEFRSLGTCVRERN